MRVLSFDVRTILLIRICSGPTRNIWWSLQYVITWYGSSVVLYSANRCERSYISPLFSKQLKNTVDDIFMSYAYTVINVRVTTNYHSRPFSHGNRAIIPVEDVFSERNLTTFVKFHRLIFSVFRAVRKRCYRSVTGMKLMQVKIAAVSQGPPLWPDFSTLFRFTDSCWEYLKRM